MGEFEGRRGLERPDRKGDRGLKMIELGLPGESSLKEENLFLGDSIENCNARANC